MLKINEVKDRIKNLTRSAKMKEMDMLADKDELEAYKEALLMKEQEALQRDREVQLELKRVQDITQRIDDKVESLQIPPPKYYFPPGENWSYVNGVPANNYYPQVYCQTCHIHHHPHHHCTKYSACCSPKPKFI